MDLTQRQITLKLIRDNVVNDGGPELDDETIDYYAKYGSVPEGTVSEDYDAHIEDLLAEAFDACGLEVGSEII